MPVLACLANNHFSLSSLPCGLGAGDGAEPGNAKSCRRRRGWALLPEQGGVGWAPWPSTKLCVSHHPSGSVNDFRLAGGGTTPGDDILLAFPKL